MTAVMICVDPAKRSHAMAVLDGNEKEQAVLQVRNDNDGYREMLRLAKRWKQRTWAVEVPAGSGCSSLNGSSLTERPSSMCHRSWRSAAGSSTPVTVARTTRVMRGPSLSWPCGLGAYARSCSTTNASRCS